MSSNSVNLTNIDKTQSQFDEISSLINTINANISDLDEELTSEMNNVNTLLNLKANSVDDNNSIIGINARLDTKVISSDLASSINNLNTSTANFLNANSVSLLTILTLTDSSIQSELDTKANLNDMVSGFTSINTNITGINNNLISSVSHINTNINLTNNNLVSGFSNITNNLISSVSSINYNI